MYHNSAEQRGIVMDTASWMSWSQNNGASMYIAQENVVVLLSCRNSKVLKDVLKEHYNLRDSRGG